MNKAELLKVRLPDLYQDCSDWFEGCGVDSIPSLLDFIHSGREKQDYEKFQQLYTIEQMKRYLKEVDGEELDEANALINEEIRKYDMIE